MKYIGSMFIETAEGVVEVGMAETPQGIVPGGFRDAITHERPRLFPTVEQIREAIELSKWFYLNKVVFTEARVSNVSMAEWPPNTDLN